MQTSSNSTDIDDRLRAVLVPGQDIVVAQAFGFPGDLIRALSNHHERLEGSRIFFGMIPGDLPELPEVHMETLFPFGRFGTEQAMRDRGMRYCRQSLYEIARGYRDGTRPVDVVLAAATPARRGVHSLGPAVDYIHPAAERASAVVLEIIEDLPWTGEGSALRAGDAVLPIASSQRAPTREDAGASDLRLAEQLLDWIPNGATLEFGMGKWSLPLLALLGRTRQGLRLHTGSFGDWIMPLVASGALARSSPLVATALGGSRAFYDAIPELGISLVPAYVTHDPALLRALPRFRAVNSVLEVDLLGRANSEFGGGGRRGGLGGLPDFARGAAANPDGLSILALNAAAGDSSRVVARLPKEHVSLDETSIDIIVTEFGGADLRGKGTKERVEAMLLIAAPDHRARLAQDVRILGLLD